MNSQTESVVSAESPRVALINDFANEWLQKLSVHSEALRPLVDSLRYSLANGGKRTRPVLGLIVGEQLGVSPRHLLPWVLAVEMIHTYSLIHDDLPAMDNDDFRRGKPTNHKVFGEATALLAGDILLTEAFGLVARSYCGNSERGIHAVALLSDAAGFAGMCGGQAIDLNAKLNHHQLDSLLDLHARKTGCLFRVVCEGVAVLSGSSVDLQNRMRQFGASLGLCFQLADDLIDSTDKIEAGSVPALVGLAGTRKLLESESNRARAALKEIGIVHGPLIDLVGWNEQRTF